MKETTFAKALGLDELAKAQRAESAQAAETIGERIDQCKRKLALRGDDYDSLTKSAARSDRLQKGWDNLAKLAAQCRRQRASEDVSKRLASMVKSELLRRRTDGAEVTLAKAQQKAAESNFLKATAEQAAEDLVAQVTQLQFEIEKQTADFDARVAVVTANAERGIRAQELQRCRISAAAEVRQERERDYWLAKANTTDPILRGVYLARADGREFDDDDD